MNERVTDETVRQAARSAADSQPARSIGNELRIDQAHHLNRSGDGPSPHDELHPESADQFFAEESAARQPETNPLRATPATSKLDTHFLNEVSQLAQQLHLQIQSEKCDLEARERTLQDQAALFETEKLRFIHEIAHELAQAETLKAQLQENEATLSRRQIDFELQARQVETERDTLQLERTEFEQRKLAVRGEVMAEVQAERNEVERLKSNLREEQDRVQLLKAWLQQRLDELAIENDRTLQSEREKLWQSLTTEWEQRQVAFQQQSEDWSQTRDLERSEIEREKALFESTVQSANAEFLGARESLIVELSDLREQTTLQLQSERSEWERSREQQQAELVATRQALELKIAKATEELATIRQNLQATWEESRRDEETESQAARESLAAELVALRDEHAETLRSERNDWEQARDQENAELATKQAEFLREQTLVENRIRFQQDHLEKSRFEFEQAQNTYRHERQVERQRIEETNILMIRRLRQMDLYRSSIDEREKSLDRQQELFDRTQKAITSSVDLDRLSFQAEREAWEQERQIQFADVRRQKEAMATLAENMESRRVRLDKLRAELEETHRATLEMRLAVEETWAQLTQVAGQDEARQREQVRESLIGYYQKIQASLEEQRREQFDALAKFERQRAEFTEERLKLTNWFASRDEELKLGEERIRTAATEASSNHIHWLAARDRWLLEKAEAEKLIRRLLASLGETNRDQSREVDAVFALNENRDSAA
jgi:hypothetical protein